MLQPGFYKTNAVAGLRCLPENSVDCIVTSPPYKTQDGYSADLIRGVAYAAMRCLKPGGLYFLNFGHLADFKERPFEVVHETLKAKDYKDDQWLVFTLVDTIMWVKNHYSPVQGDRRLNNLSEFVFLFAKGEWSLDRLSIGVPYADPSNAKRWASAKGKNLKCRGNVWNIDYPTIQRVKQKNHPHRFPPELPETCLKLAGLKKGAVVVDPFCGSGTTVKVAKSMGFKAYGFDLTNKWRVR